MGMLISTEYFYPTRKERGKGRNPDKIFMVIKEKDGNKKRICIERPNFEYYITIPEYEDNYDELNEQGRFVKYLKREHVRAVKTPYMDLFNSIVKELKDPEVENYYKRTINAQDKSTIRNNLNKIHADFRLHGTDLNIEDYYMYEYLKDNDYEKNNFGLTKWFADIEVDSSEIIGFPNAEQARCPVNAISCFDLDNKIMRGYFLRYDGEESFEKFKKNYNKIIKKLKYKYKHLKEFYPDIKEGINNIDLEFDIKFFDEEIDLIQQFFDDINEFKPDFLSCWNADFDLLYLTNRVDNLGYDVTEVCCPIEFKQGEKKVYIKIDNKKDLSDKHSQYNISGYTNYIDEMALYANITKPLGKEESYSLDYIGEKITGMHKDEHEESLKTLHFDDYETFFAYNIQDSFLLGMIDFMTSHIDLKYTVSIITRTKINNAMKKTVCMRNLSRVYAIMNHLVQSNNRSKLYEKPEGKVPGAYVAPPQNIDEVGMYINGILSRYLFECVIDFDLASLYPSITRALNISLETLVGTIYCDINGNSGINLAQDYLSNDNINFGHKYFNLPLLDEILDEIDKGEYDERQTA